MKKYLDVNSICKVIDVYLRLFRCKVDVQALYSTTELDPPVYLLLLTKYFQVFR